jgi:hypothetical protein
MNKRYQVFLSSTYVDLKEEREEILRILLKLNCFPAGMELFPATDEKQFDYIKKEIDNSDYYLLIIAGRYGSLTPEGISYTEKEFLYALEKKIPVIAFIHKDINNIPLGKVDVDENIRKKLEEFKKKVETNRLVKYWADSTTLYREVSITLARVIHECPRIGWVRGDEKNEVSNKDELRKLKEEIKVFKKNKEEYHRLIGGNIADLEEEYSIEFEICSTFWGDIDKVLESKILTFSWTEWYNQIVTIMKKRSLKICSSLSIEELIKATIYEIVDLSSNDLIVRFKNEIIIDFQNQFVALGFIKVKQTQFELRWELTQKGEKYYALLNCKKS